MCLRAQIRESRDGYTVDSSATFEMLISAKLLQPSCWRLPFVNQYLRCFERRIEIARISTRLKSPH